MQHYECIILDSATQQYLNILDTKTSNLLGDEKKRLTSNDRLVVVGGVIDGSPAALAIASTNGILKTAKILIFYLPPQYRNQTFATELMTTLLDALKKKGATGCEIFYIKEETDTPFLETLLNKTGWQPPSLFMLRYIFNIDTFKPDWLYRQYTYVEGLKEFFWKDLTKEDRQLIEFKENQRHFPAAISPFLDEGILDPLNSLGIKDHDGVVGWILTHKIDNNTMRYSSFYVDRSLRDKQLTTKLLARAILLQHAQSPLRRSVVEISLHIVSRHWIQFAKRRLEPQAIEVQHLLQAWRNL